jgi:hypothetical protein
VTEEQKSFKQVVVSNIDKTLEGIALLIVKAGEADATDKHATQQLISSLQVVKSVPGLLALREFYKRPVTADFLWSAY